jgi:ADP-ribose pyrophosphatase YjhB (NUDIX family)
MRQAAAFPYRFQNGRGGPIQVLLVTSSCQRWILPKGDIDFGFAPHRAAEKEAFEEGGVRGTVSDRSIGSFCHRKDRNGAAISIEVEVYPLEVAHELSHWPEMHRRERRWLSLEEAAGVVEDGDLAEIIRSFQR